MGIKDSILFGFNRDLGLLIGRIAGGGMMLFAHGLPKVFKFGDLSTTFPDPFGIGSLLSLTFACFAEFVCAFLLIIGWNTRAILIPLITTMAVAAFVIHGSDPFGRKELALLYLVVYVVLFFSGPGKMSIDGKLYGNKIP